MEAKRKCIDERHEENEITFNIISTHFPTQWEAVRIHWSDMRTPAQ